MNLAIITARGNSKRIPEKNIKEFQGKPIIAYSIEAALASNLFDEVMVSTDSKKIADIAMSYDASVPFMRSAENSSDTATTADVITEVIQAYKNTGKNCDIIICIYPTAPFITPDVLKRAYELLISDESLDAVIPITKFSYPPQRGLIIHNDIIEMRESQYKLSRSQDLEPMYHDAGQFYALRTEHFLETHDIWSGKIKPIVLPDKAVQDIDTHDDWLIAEMKYKLIKEQNENGKE